MQLEILQKLSLPKMIRVGIFFGGASREREVSFSGGRTVYDNLNKSIFEAIPFFVDSFNNIVKLNWQYIYKGSIRDFYPPASFLPKQTHDFQIYAESLLTNNVNEKTLLHGLGTQLNPSDLKQEIDFAFLALHGAFGEDGTIQGMLEWLGIPYSGSGIFPSAFGMNKSLQKKLMANTDFETPDFYIFTKQQWDKNRTETRQEILQNIGLPLVVKSGNQGSSIGVSVVKHQEDLTGAVEKALFRKQIQFADWQTLGEAEKVAVIKDLTDIKSGLGLPLFANGTLCRLPEELLQRLNNCQDLMLLEAVDAEFDVVVESYIEGREFSCIVIESENAKPLALPPTEIIKTGQVYDYRSKYLPGLTNKVTPIDLDSNEVQRIRAACEKLFAHFNFNVYARIDGFYNQGHIYLNDPNTTSGMLPSSFFFHQAAEVGLHPGAFLTYIIEASLKARSRNNKLKANCDALLHKLNNALEAESAKGIKKKIAVVMGGSSSERHISVESGRNIYEKLASSAQYEPIPVFLIGDEKAYKLYKIPVNYMLKDNADDISQKIASRKKNVLLDEIRQECEALAIRYTHKPFSDTITETSVDELKLAVDAVFIALHGRPGEDGTLQKELERVGLPYNGSGVESSATTINKYKTNRILEKHGKKVANAFLVYKSDFEISPEVTIARAETTLSYPMIAKPADDGCSAAVKKIENSEQLMHYANMLFRKDKNIENSIINALGLAENEEIPIKDFFLLESLITAEDAPVFLEITGGLLTKKSKNGQTEYEIFEASETLAQKGILSLEEKFLAGQGQNITPARYESDDENNKKVSEKVKAELLDAAQILNLEGYARIDAFVRIYSPERVEVIFIEVNSLPGMTPATCIFHQAAIQNYKPDEFIDNILQYGFSKFAKNV